MKSFFVIFFIISTSSCSFDNKTGIWKDASNTPVETQPVDAINENNVTSRFEDIFIKKEMFSEEIKITENLKLNLDSPTENKNWLEKFGVKTNNISNSLYSGNKILISKSSKLSKHASNESIVFFENNLISFDHKGKIFFFSLDINKKIFDYNFYKKEFKNIKKILYLTVDKNILYVADNLGYIYAINLNNKLLIWAKNYGIPFRSNIKIADDQILIANQDNLIYSIDTKTGNKNWQFATSLTFLKSDFKNNFVVDEINKNLYFLNTSGELYSISYDNKKINWVLNFKNSSLTDNTDLFLSQPMVLKKNNLIISTEKALLSFNVLTGSRQWSFPSNSILKPILTKNYVYILSKNDLLICLDNKTGKVLWSKNIYNNLDKNLIKKKINNFHQVSLANNQINLFSKSGYLALFNYKNGNLEYIKKISKNGISSEIIFMKKNMFLIDNKNKLLKFN